MYPDFSTTKGVWYGSNVSKGIRNIFSQSILDFYMYCDGYTDIERISEKININYKKALKYYNILKKEKIIK